MQETQEREKKERSRRDFFSGIGAAAAVAAVAAAFNGPKKAYADVYGGDTTVLTEISIWLKLTWTSQIVPMIDLITKWYNEVKSWINSWNDFVSTFNKGMSFAEDIRNFVTRKEDNWFYQTYVQMNKYIQHMLRVDGDILHYRLQYLNPILIQKIDSMMSEVQYLVREAESVAKKLGKNGDDSFFRQSKTGKAAIRVTNDQAKYLESISELSAIRQTLEKTKADLKSILENNKSPESSARIYHDLIAPQMLDATLLQCSILSEIYAKMNDFFLIMIQKDPIISKHEDVVKPFDMKKFIEELSKKAEDKDKGEGKFKRSGFLF